MSASSVASAFAGFVSDDRLLTGPGREPWMVGGELPGAVAFPVSDGEVAALLERASKEGLRVMPAGAGTALDTLPLEGAPDLVLSTARMTGVTEYEPADLTLTARAGLTLGALDEATRRNGQWLPLDPPGWRDATLGGLLATGSAGPLQAEFGTPRDHVLGLTLVTGDGRVLEVGGRVVKNVAGYDLVRLATGSGGSLGVITLATVRLHPVPEADGTLVLAASSMEELVPAARRLATAPVIVSCLELAEPGTDGKGAILAARVVGSREAVDHALGLLAGELDPEVAGKADTLRGARGAELFADLTRRETGGIVLRLALLPKELDSLVRVARELAGGCGLPGHSPPALAVHVTRGRLRIALPELPRDADALARLHGAVQHARNELESRGGSLTVVSGPPKLAGPAASLGSGGHPVARLLAGIEETFDPAGVLPPVRRTR